MTKFGYKLMSEEHGPRDLVRNARLAEEAGFDFVAISDHYHPWLRSQGHSPYAWSVLGALAAGTESVEIVTAVTCPFLRYHPAIIAQAAATVAILSGGRFTLGLGSGEKLNEHVVGNGWPPVRIRHEMLSEAIDIIRLLWRGGMQSYEGKHLTIEQAQVFDLPSEPPEIIVAIGGKKAARLAADKAEGIFTVESDPRLIEYWTDAGGFEDGPKYAEIMLSWAESEEKAVDVAYERFRFGTAGWKVNAELPNVAHFEAHSSVVHKEDITDSVVCGPDPELHAAAIEKYIDAGYDHIVIIAAGPRQKEFLGFWEKELSPLLAERMRNAKEPPGPGISLRT